MTAHELFQTSSAEKSSEVVRYLRTTDRDSYRAVMKLVAERRKLRPVFLEKKPGDEQIRWVAEALGKKNNEDLALEVLQNWILEAHSEMVLQFLDQLGIEHDGKGVIEETPKEPEAETVSNGVEQLLTKHDPETVRIYLQLFIEMDRESWPNLASILESHPQLQTP